VGMITAKAKDSVLHPCLTASLQQQSLQQQHSSSRNTFWCQARAWPGKIKHNKQSVPAASRKSDSLLRACSYYSKSLKARSTGASASYSVSV
jgi:hypothetical protein